MVSIGETQKGAWVMSITFRHHDDFNYLITLTEKEMGLLHSQLKGKDMKQKFNQNQNFQILKKKSPIGFVSFCNDEEYLFLDLIVLEKEAQHQGIGKKVMKRLETEARKKQKQAIYLYVSKHDQKAIAAFQKYGFSITDQGRRYWVMEKAIQPKVSQHLEDKFLRIHFPL